MLASYTNSKQEQERRKSTFVEADVHSMYKLDDDNDTSGLSLSFDLRGLRIVESSALILTVEFDEVEESWNLDRGQRQGARLPNDESALFLPSYVALLIVLVKWSTVTNSGQLFSRICLD